MVLQRLSDNISGRRRRQTGSKVQIRARLLNRLGYKAFFLARKKVTPRSDDEENLKSSSVTVATDAAVSSAALSPPSVPNVPSRLPRQSSSVTVATDAAVSSAALSPPSVPNVLSRLPRRVSYYQDLHGRDTKTNPIDADSAPRVHFHHQVSVVEIPSRDFYSPSQKKRMWRSKQEVVRMARRNRIEYNHDGKDWRTAKEEEDMVDLGNGDYIHPKTYSCLFDNEDLDPELVPNTGMSSRHLEAKYETSLKRRKGLKAKRPSIMGYV